MFPYSSYAAWSLYVSVYLVWRTTCTVAYYVFIYRILILCRWVYDHDLTMVRKSLGGYGIFVPLLVRRLKGSAYRQGIGRHSYQEVMALLKEDMKALSVFIGRPNDILTSWSVVSCIFITVMLYLIVIFPKYQLRIFVKRFKFNTV